MTLTADKAPPTWRTDRRVRELVLGYLALKAGLVLVAYLSRQIIPLDYARLDANPTYPLSGVPDWFSAFATWDTSNYLRLVDGGYGQSTGTDTFFPLYPALILLLKPLVLGHGIIAAWVVANAVSLLVPVYMYKLGVLFWPREKAFRSVLLLLAFPTAFFLSTAYSESIFLALVLMAFYYLFTRRIWLASAFCVLIPLARPPGLMFVIPVLVVGVTAALTTGADRASAIRAALRTYWLPVVASLVGVAIYLAFATVTMGGPFAGLDAQSYYINGNSLSNLLTPITWFRENFFETELQLVGYIDGWPERIAFLLLLPILVGVVLTQHKALAAYAVLYFLVPALSGHLMSFTRFVLVVFPLFYFLGSGRRWTVYLIPPMFCLQMLYFIMHVNMYWVA